MSIRDTSAADTAEQLRLQVGRRAPYTQVGDWVLLAPIRHTAKLLYWALSAHINGGRDDTKVWPTQDDLAAMLGYSEGRKIRPFLQELAAIDAIEVGRSERYSTRMRERRIYTINQSPPPGYEHPESLRDFYLLRKAQIAAAQALEADSDTAEGVAGGAAEQGAAAAEGGEETPRSPRVGRNGPLRGGDGGQAGEPGHEGAGMGPTGGGRNGPAGKGRVGAPNKKKENQTNINQTKSGGAIRRPPTPPAVINRGHFSEVVTDQLKLTSNQLTARAEKTESPAETTASAPFAGAGPHQDHDSGRLDEPLSHEPAPADQRATDAYSTASVGVARTPVCGARVALDTSMGYAVGGVISAGPAPCAVGNPEHNK